MSTDSSYWVAWSITFFVGLIWWIVVHFTVVPLTRNILEFTIQKFNHHSYLLQMIQQIENSAKSRSGIDKLYNLRRYFKSQVYCLIATASGAYIFLTEYRSWPMSLLHHWSPLNFVFFTIAVTYWLVAGVEDFLAGEEVSSQLNVQPGETRAGLNEDWLFCLFSHHSITILAYMWSIVTHKLGGLCVMGLLFEAPVLLLNMRDIAAGFEQELDYPYRRLSRFKFTAFYIILMITFHLCRTTFCLLWPISLIIWRSELATLPLLSQIAYHYFGLSFNAVLLSALKIYFHRYILEDMVRMRIILQITLWKLLQIDHEQIEDYFRAEGVRMRLEALQGQEEPHEQHTVDQQESSISIAIQMQDMGEGNGVGLLTRLEAQVGAANDEQRPRRCGMDDDDYLLDDSPAESLESRDNMEMRMLLQPKDMVK